MENTQEYMDMAHVADIVSHEKTNKPEAAVKAQFGMWVVEKFKALEDRISALEGAKEESSDPSEEAGEPVEQA